jgi:hypothetical protein
MTEIKKTLAILKARWPEVAFIIGIYLLTTLSGRLLLTAGRKSIPMTYLTIIFVLLLFLLIGTLLRFGFLRTVYLEGQKRQALIVLLRTGNHFFWRMFALVWIYAFPVTLSIIMFSKLIPSHVIPWFYTLYSTLVNLILIKLMVLIPALIIVLDCRVFDSFRFFRRYKLLNAKELVFSYCGNIALVLLASTLSHYCSITTISQYILSTVFSIITYFISLMIAVMAVRFVASCNLVYDNHKAPLNSGSLQEH